jgi:zinc protease
MNRRFLLIALAGGLFPGAHLSAFAADPLPSPESILDRYVEVTGGKQVYEKRKSEIATGTLEYPAQGIKGTITRYETEPDNYYATLEIPGIGKIEMGVNGDVAWENSAIMGPHIKSGEEKRQAIREATMNSTLYWRKLFPKVETAGVEMVDGQECYKVVLTPAEGNAETMYFQKKSGLAVKTTMVAVSQAGDIPVEVTVADYKNFGGVMAPAKVTQKAAGQEFTISIDKVQVNAEIPAERFALPPEIRALLDKSKAPDKNKGAAK